MATNNEEVHPGDRDLFWSHIDEATGATSLHGYNFPRMTRTYTHQNGVAAVVSTSPDPSSTTTTISEQEQGLGEEEEAEIDFVAHVKDNYGQALTTDDEVVAIASDEDVGTINAMDLDLQA
jgi:hypothetical protein|uniref:Uncharacterized protein n=1 Tax=Zea mays TaxID=4577 RepID=A0A804LDH9_MAIZE